MTAGTAKALKIENSTGDLKCTGHVLPGWCAPDSALSPGLNRNRLEAERSCWGTLFRDRHTWTQMPLCAQLTESRIGPRVWTGTDRCNSTRPGRETPRVLTRRTSRWKESFIHSFPSFLPLSFTLLSFKIFFYLFMKDRQREAEDQQASCWEWRA